MNQNCCLLVTLSLNLILSWYLLFEMLFNLISLCLFRRINIPFKLQYPGRRKTVTGGKESVTKDMTQSVKGRGTVNLLASCPVETIWTLGFFLHWVSLRVVSHS